MKKITCIVLSLLLLFLFACGDVENPPVDDSTHESSSETPASTDYDSPDPSDADSPTSPTVSDYIPPETETTTDTTAESTTAPTEGESAVIDYATFSGEYSAGDRISFELYYIEPTYTVEQSGQLTLDNVFDPSDRGKNFISKCYTNADHSEFLYMYISGNDYCDNFTGTDLASSLSFYLPPVVVAEAVYSDTIAEDFSATSGTLISFKFIEVSDKAEYDEAKAIPLSDDHGDGEKVYIESIYSIEPVSYTCHSVGGISIEYELDYIICVCKSADNSKAYQIAIEIDDYNTHINPKANLTFDSLLKNISGNTDTVYFSDPITIYGFARETGMFIQGTSDYAYTILFHHTDE